MTPAMISIRDLIDAVRRGLQRDTWIAAAALAACALPAALLLGWLAARLQVWSRPSGAPLLVLLAAAALIVFVGIRARRRWLRALDEPAVAGSAERRLGLPDGAVRGVLELGRAVPPGTSSALFRRAEHALSRDFQDRAIADVAGNLGDRVRRRRRAAVAALATTVGAIAVLGVSAPDRARAGWAPLLHPVRHLAPPPLPALVVEPGDIAVPRGSDVVVRVRAPGREAVTLHWQTRGDVPRQEVGMVAADTASLTIASVESPVTYWVRAPDGTSSARFRIVPTDPLLVAELAIDVVFPAYLARPAEHYQGDVPPLELPEGSRLVVRGRATRELSAAAIVGADPARPATLETRAENFRGEWEPRTSGIYTWQLRDRQGAAPAVALPPLEIVVVADAAPTVEVSFPGVDTLLDASLRQIIVADARDDHGIAAATLVSWRVARSGQSDPEVEQHIVIGSGADHALLRSLLNALDRNVLPGDMLRYFVRVTDNSPRSQTAVSRTYSLRLPTPDEMRDRALRQADNLARRAETMNQNAAELQEATRSLDRRTAAANQRRAAAAQRGAATGEKMEFSDAQEARQVLEQHEQMLSQIAEMRENVNTLDRAMAEAGLQDPALQQRLEELRELYDQLLTPEMRQQLDQLRQALDELDPEEVQEALAQLARNQEELQEQLERSMEMLRRAAAEQAINELAQDARELATQQQALAEAMREETPTRERTATQEDLARQGEELARSLTELTKDLAEQGEAATSEKTEEAQSQSREAARNMTSAAQQAARQEGEEAGRSGEQAADQLEKTATALDDARKAMAEASERELQESVEQAMSDALSLAERQNAILDEMNRAEEQDGQQKQDGQESQQEAQQQGAQQQGAQQQGGQQQGGQQQGGQQQGGQQQGGQQQGGQQQGGQQQGGQQQGGQQQGGQQQGGQQQGGQQQGGQQQGQQQGGQQQGGQQGGGQQGGGSPTGRGSGAPDVQSIRSEQADVQQGLRQLGENLAEARQQSGTVNQDVGQALSRANRAMEQTMEGLQQAAGSLPTQEAGQSVDALNQLALSLLHSAQQMQQEAGSGAQQTMRDMAELARQQANLNGQSNSLMPMDLSQSAMAQQLERLSRDQSDIARRLGEMNRSSAAREVLTGDLTDLTQEAELLARQLAGGRLPPDVLARQERLFHRMLDAGRSLEKDEVSEERTAERPGEFEARTGVTLDNRLFEDPTRFRVPTAAELENYPPQLRRLILDYFERLNRPATAGSTPNR